MASGAGADGLAAEKNLMSGGGEVFAQITVGGFGGAINGFLARFSVAETVARVVVGENAVADGLDEVGKWLDII